MPVLVATSLPPCCYRHGEAATDGASAQQTATTSTLNRVRMRFIESPLERTGEKTGGINRDVFKNPGSTHVMICDRLAFGEAAACAGIKRAGASQRFDAGRANSVSLKENRFAMSGLPVGFRSTATMTLSSEEILRLLMRSRDRVAAAAWVVVRDAHAAEDIFQNVAIKALTRQVSFDSEGAVLSWAFISARREAIDWLRKHRNESAAPGTEILELLDQDWLAAEEEDHRAAALRECLQELPGRSRELLRLRYFDGLSCAKVARQVGAKTDAVYKRLSRLHQLLKECVHSQLEENRTSEA